MLDRLFRAAGWTAWSMRRWKRQADVIAEMSERLKSLDDAALARRGSDLRWRALSGAPLASLLEESYALVREAARRAHGQSHYPVQLVAGIALFDGGVVEMQTGEGKTLTAVLPTFLFALSGRGCHVVTANDYLAQRDADFARAIYQRLGLSVGCVHSSVDSEKRRAEYDCDVTYGTSREFGFDFLRDRIALARRTDFQSVPHSASSGATVNRPEGAVQRGHYFALVDEADSVLIDDARTPLLIASPQENNWVTESLFRWCAGTARELVRVVDFTIEGDTRRARLTNHGCRSVLGRSKPPGTDSLDMERIYSQIEHALVAQHMFQRDRDYVVADKSVAIVDESTGRVAEGRKWQEGLHQAVEAKEGVPISETTQTAARITVQSYFRRYQHSAGLTGTAHSSRREFRRIFKLHVVRIPPRLPCQRKGLPPRVFLSQAAKHKAIATEIEQRLAAGQAVLVGTPSVAASEELSDVLVRRGIVHQVLNCRHHEQEAKIIQQAGHPGRVTIATNMAGRGTDVRVHDEVLRAGGLHVIATEMHSSARIDRQLIGRTARQGEPGSYQFFLSMEDELFRGLQSELEAARRRAHPDEHGELPPNWLSLFQRTQRKLERHHERQRKDLLKQERKRDDLCRGMGLDPLLETVE